MCKFTSESVALRLRLWFEWNFSSVWNPNTPQMKQLFVLRNVVWSRSFLLHRSCSGSHDVSKWFSASNICASWIRFTGIHSIPFPFQCFWSLSCTEQLWWSDFRSPVCFLSDHRRERSAESSGFTSATRVPPRGPFPSPPSSTSTPHPPACLHPTSRLDAPSSPVHRHRRGCGWHELSVHLPVPSSSYLLGPGWVGASGVWAVLLHWGVVYLCSTLYLHSAVIQLKPESNCLVFEGGYLKALCIWAPFSI